MPVKMWRDENYIQWIFVISNFRQEKNSKKLFSIIWSDGHFPLNNLLVFFYLKRNASVPVNHLPSLVASPPFKFQPFFIFRLKTFHCRSLQTLKTRKTFDSTSHLQQKNFPSPNKGEIFKKMPYCQGNTLKNNNAWDTKEKGKKRKTRRKAVEMKKLVSGKKEEWKSLTARLLDVWVCMWFCFCCFFTRLSFAFLKCFFRLRFYISLLLVFYLECFKL